MITRRQLMLGGTTMLAGIGTRLESSPSQMKPGKEKTPLVHTTDLYHPPQDPDDHIDLATVVALQEFDLKGVILDATQRFLDAAPAGFDISRDPGLVPVAQLGYLLGRTIPAAVGPVTPLESPDDAVAKRPLKEQGGVRLLLDILEDSPEPVVISVVGSARVVTAAYNRNPQLVRAKTRTVLLNAGSTGGSKREWNVGLDPAAYIGLWSTGLPIDWYPCATEGGAFNESHERGTYWKTTHAQLFGELPQSLQSWFAYGLAGSTRGDVVRALEEGGNGDVWQKLLPTSRNLWATASLVMAAGRILVRTPAGWRFVRVEKSGGDEVWPWRLDPIDARVDGSGEVQWRLTEARTNARLFGRRAGAGFGAAMAEALHALLVAMKI